MNRFEATICRSCGGVPATAADESRFGTETSCIEVQCGSRTQNLDAGTGIIGCGRKLMMEKVDDFDALLTSCNLDRGGSARPRNGTGDRAS